MTRQPQHDKSHDKPTNQHMTNPKSAKWAKGAQDKFYREYQLRKKAGK
jgi:hypothetical protein